MGRFKLATRRTMPRYGQVFSRGDRLAAGEADLPQSDYGEPAPYHPNGPGIDPYRGRLLMRI